MTTQETTLDLNNPPLNEAPVSEAFSPFGSCTDVGMVREQNEDSLIVAAPLFVVADGMGGHAAGEVASEIAVNTVAECAPDYADAEKLGAAVEVANREIINAALTGRGREGMGTTCTAAMLEDNHLVIAQVGDSRAYLLHGHKLTQITRDHSLMTDLIEAGKITPEQARHHPQRSVITRALGNDVNMVPDLYEIDIQEGDRVLLCSDGLSSMLRDQRIEDLMVRHPNPQECANALVKAALDAGGLDNVTVIVAAATDASHIQRKRVARKTKLTVGIILILLASIIGLAAWGISTYLHESAYIAQSSDGYVQVYRGVPGTVLGIGYSELVETTDVLVSDLNSSAAENIRNNMRVSNLDEALSLVESYRKQTEEKKAATTAGSNATASSDADSSQSTDEGVYSTSHSSSGGDTR